MQFSYVSLFFATALAFAATPVCSAVEAFDESEGEESPAVGWLIADKAAQTSTDDDFSAAGCVACSPYGGSSPWEFYGGLLMLRRDLAGDNVVSSDGAGPVTFLSDFDSDYEPGFELGVRRTGCYAIAELKYFQVTSFNERVTGPSTFGPFVSEYDSDLYNAEFNLLSNPCGRFHLLAGFRYLAYNETITFDAGPIDSELSVSNDLYGLQLGAEWNNQWCTPRGRGLQLGAFAKCMGSYQESNSSPSLIVGGPIPITGDSDDDVVVGCEGGVRVGLNLSQRLRLTAGYRVLYLHDIVLAGRQPVVVPPGFTQITPGEVFFHGLETGISYVW